MLNARVVIASPSNAAIEKILIAEPRFAVLARVENGIDALHEAVSQKYDLLLLRGVLSGMDGLSVIKKISEATLCTPPRILFLSDFPGSAWQKEALSLGADQAIQFPCPDAFLLNAALSAAFAPVPALARDTMPCREAAAADMIHTLSISDKLKGAACICYGAAVLSCCGKSDIALGEWLYPEIARKCGLTPAAVERNIRTAIESAWLKGSLKAIQDLFGLSVDAERGKPTNAEFLFMLADHIRRRVCAHFTP